tara:strand:+ start:1486 stop:1845 length:360 start_codon:yes stop_codon:yes gene_type:complete
MHNISKVKYCEIQEPLNESCAITQEDFNPNDDVGVINHCNHVFNYDALLNWMIQHHSCPNCRYNILTNSNLIRYSNSGYSNPMILSPDQLRHHIANNIVNNFINSDGSLNSVLAVNINN